MGHNTRNGNRLDDLEFCIRKGVGVYCIRKYLNNANKTQAELAEFLTTTQPTISRWNHVADVEEFRITSTSESRYAPSSMHLIQLSSFFHKSLHTMLKDVIREEQANPCLYSEETLLRIMALAAGMEENAKSPPEQKGADCFGIPYISYKLQRSRYLGFFLSLNPKKPVEHFIIDTAKATKSASVPAFARVIGKAENIYRCSIVSPPNQKHLYIYLRQDNGKQDRGLIVFKVDNDIQGPFDCGSGIILSTDRKSEEKRLQWVAILRIGENHDPLTAECSDERNAPQIQEALAAKARILNNTDTAFEQEPDVKTADAFIESILREPLPSPNGCYMDFGCLKDRQDVLYEQFTGGMLQKLSFIYDEQ